jgi:hypothetical protein
MKGIFRNEIFNTGRDDFLFSGGQIYHFCARYLRWIFGIHV